MFRLPPRPTLFPYTTLFRSVRPEILERGIERRMEAAADLAGPAHGEDQLLLVELDARLVRLEALHVAQAVGVEILEQRRERLLDLAPRDAFEDGNVGVDVDFMPHGEHLGRERPILPLKSRIPCSQIIQAAASSIWSPRLSRPAAESRVIRSSPRCPLRNFPRRKTSSSSSSTASATATSRGAAPVASSPGAGTRRSRRCFRRPPHRRSPPRTPAARRSSTGSPAGSPTLAQPAASLPLCNSAAAATCGLCSRGGFFPGTPSLQTRSFPECACVRSSSRPSKSSSRTTTCGIAPAPSGAPMRLCKSSSFKLNLPSSPVRKESSSMPTGRITT